MKNYTIEEYQASDCPFIASVLGISMHNFTNGHMCDTGCYNFDNGKCSSYIKLTSETVREEAARRCMSIKKIRTERRNKANMAYLKIKDAPSNVWEFWFEHEVNDNSKYAEECYQYFLIYPNTKVNRVKYILRDLAIAGIQAKVFIGKIDHV